MKFEKNMDNMIIKNPVETVKTENIPAEADQLVAEAESVLAGAAAAEAAKTAEEAKVLKDIESLKNQEPKEETINKINDYKQRVQDWENIVIVSRSNTGVGGASFTNKPNFEELAARYPGLKEIAEKLNKVAADNKVGWQVWKNPKLDDFSAQVIKNYLTTGSMGRFTNEGMAKKAQEAINKFLAENKFKEAENPNEDLPKSLAEAILGEKDVNSYKAEISALEEKLKEAA